MLLPEQERRDSRDVLLAEGRIPSLQGLGVSSGAQHHITAASPAPLHFPAQTSFTKKAVEAGETCRVSFHTHLLCDGGCSPQWAGRGILSTPEPAQDLGGAHSRMGLQKDLHLQLGLCLLFPIPVGLGQTLSWSPPARRE